MVLPLTPVRFKQHAARIFGNKDGVACGDLRITYGEFNERCDRFSSALAEIGVKAHDRVAFLGFNCHRLLEAYYAVPQIHAILLPLNIRLNAEELAQILQDCEPRFLFFDPEFTPTVETLRAGAPCLRQCICLNEPRPEWAYPQTHEELLAQAKPREFDFRSIDENSVAELFYTSGTTAHPKGVMLTHRSLYLHALYVASALRLGDDDTGIYTVPLFHVNSWGSPHTLTLAGARHVILRKFDPQTLIDLIDRERVTRLQMVPSMAIALINNPDFSKHDLSCVKEVMIGGAPSNVTLIRQVEEKFPGARIAGGYGLTETSPVVSIAYIKDHRKNDESVIQQRRKATAGYSIAGVEARVVDADGRDVPANGQETGEVIIRSDTVMEGYWNDPEESARALRDGWLHTGDLATIDEEGYILVVDRIKDMVLSGGENIATAEIERVIYQHPAVLECAVIAVPDEQWGEAAKALVTLRPGREATEEEILAHCRRHLAGFKTPKTVEFRDSLPKGGTGKILKRVLREPYWQGHERRVH
ncbi:MAG TPA: fatty acid--CoA ligase [Terriglobia bacterium]|nr:fatty acid--CoA ligase [Terriglobia bacterium]